MNRSEREAIEGRCLAWREKSEASSFHRNLSGGVTASARGPEEMICSKYDSHAGTTRERMSGSPVQQGIVDSALLFNGDSNVHARTMVLAEQQGHKRVREYEPARKEAALGGMNWVDYDVDIVDNIKKTKRFTSELMANDLATRMSMSISAEIEECVGTGGEVLCELKASPSPLSRLRKIECDYAEEKGYHSQGQETGRYGSQTQGEEVVHACAAAVEFTPKQEGLRRRHEEDDNLGRNSAFITPIKSWRQESNCSRYSRAGTKSFPGAESISPMAKREDSQGASSYPGNVHPTSPSDMKHDGNADLRRTALVRLALRNSGDALHSSPG